MIDNGKPGKPEDAGLKVLQKDNRIHGENQEDLSRSSLWERYRLAGHPASGISALNSRPDFTTP